MKKRFIFFTVLIIIIIILIGIIGSKVFTKESDKETKYYKIKCHYKLSDMNIQVQCCFMESFI